MTRFPSTRNLPEPSVLMGAEVPGGPPLRGGEPAGTDLGASLRNLLELGFACCPMCSAGRRHSLVDGGSIACPWCGGRGSVPLERARSLRAQLRAKAERGAAS